jgi:hypothetical protein
MLIEIYAYLNQPVLDVIYYNPPPDTGHPKRSRGSGTRFKELHERTD